MYIIKRIDLTNGSTYLSSRIIDHTTQRIATALSLLESCAKQLVKEEFGASAVEQSKIIDIHSLEQVSEPLVDSMLLYRIDSDPHVIHVYQRKTTVIDVLGWFINSQTVQHSFEKVCQFELEEYDKFSDEQDTDNSNTKRRSNIDEPEKEHSKMIVGNFIEELKNSERFLSKASLFNDENIDN